MISRPVQTSWGEKRKVKQEDVGYCAHYCDTLHFQHFTTLSHTSDMERGVSFLPGQLRATPGRISYTDNNEALREAYK